MVDQIHAKFISKVHSHLEEISDEISERNEKINKLDQYIYGDLLERSLDIPIGHDRTPINWLRRAVNIHRDQFMGRGFQITSTYDSEDISVAEEGEDRERLKLENDVKRSGAQQRRKLTEAIYKDNGGNSLWMDLAENASGVGSAAVKSYYDKKEQKWVLSPIESVENLYVYWDDSDFRRIGFVSYVWQVSLNEAIDKYGVPETTPTSSLGKPLVGNSYDQLGSSQTRPMVTIVETTGKVPGFGSKNGKLMEVPLGSETPVNVIMTASSVHRVVDKEEGLPRYYILPNRRERRRPWGVSDVTDSAIGINQTYIETLSDWRTVSSKVNFPKWKYFGFSMGQQLPKPEARKAQALPLGPDQDIQLIQQGDASQIDFRAQMEELKEQFVRETGLSPVLFNDPSVNANSNQALQTTMKPTTDIAEAKKSLWGPIIVEIFADALETLGKIDKSIGDIVREDDNWTLEMRWPSAVPKDDPVYQSNLLNRFNSNTISLQTFLEANGDSSEELDRIRDEVEDPITASILARVLNQHVVQKHLTPPAPEGPPEPKVNVSLRGDLTPYQEANLASIHGFNEGPFPATAGPQGNAGLISQENADNEGFIDGNAFQGGTPIQRGPDGQPIDATQQTTDQTTSSAENQEGQGMISQPGSGAPPATAEGQVAKNDQRAGK